MDTLTIILSILTGLAAICAILTFLGNRKKNISEEGANSAWLKTDMNYLRNSLDDIRLDMKDLTRQQNDAGVKLATQDERMLSIEKRIERIEVVVLK